MKIRTKSWHYKVATIKNSHPSNSLCLYFWQVIGGLLIGALGIGVITGIGFLLSTPILMWFFDSLAPGGFMVTGVIVICAIVFLLRKACEKASETTFVEVTGAWISAKKNRICPRLDFVE